MSGVGGLSGAGTGAPGGGAHVADDLGAYILGTLPLDEERGIRQHLEACATCRAELARVEGGAELLDAARLAQDPPIELEDRILHAVGRTGGARRPTPRLARVLTAALVTAVLTIGAFALGLALGRTDPAAPPPDQTVTLLGDPRAVATARIHVLPTGARRIELTVNGLTRLPDGNAWAVYLQGRDRTRRSAGTFLTDGNGWATVEMTVGASTSEYSTVVIAPADPPEAREVLAGTLQP